MSEGLDPRASVIEWVHKLLRLAGNQSRYDRSLGIALKRMEAASYEEGRRAGAAEEREACALLAEKSAPGGGWCCASSERARCDDIASSIRARGEGGGS